MRHRVHDEVRLPAGRRDGLGSIEVEEAEAGIAFLPPAGPENAVPSIGERPGDEGPKDALGSNYEDSASHETRLPYNCGSRCARIVATPLNHKSASPEQEESLPKE